MRIGSGDCRQPYSAALLDISALSLGAISKHAALALNRGAGKGGFAHNTWESRISLYHPEAGGDLVWQIGTGYFGCRREDGGFDAGRFQEQARLNSLRMIELRISPGAKPGHGGVLPGVKVSREIAEIRGIRTGETIVSPPGRSAFSTPIELLEFIARLRDLADGKPVGFKLCIGRRSDFSRSARPCGRRRSCPTLSPSMAVQAAPARRPWNSPIPWACQRGTPGCSCTAPCAVWRW